MDVCLLSIDFNKSMPHFSGRNGYFEFKKKRYKNTSLFTQVIAVDEIITVQLISKLKTNASWNVKNVDQFMMIFP